MGWTTEAMAERDKPIWPIHVSTCLSAVAYAALLLMLPLDALERGGIFSGFAVPGMLGVGSALVNVPGAMAVSRFGHRAVMTFGLASGALGAACLALIPGSLLVMGFSALICGLGMGVWGLARLIYLADTVPVERRGRAIAPVAGVHRIGMFLGPGLAGLAGDAFGPSAALLGAALLLGSSWLVIVVALVPSPIATRGPSAGEAPNPLVVLLRVTRRHGRVLGTAGAAMWALALLRSGRLLLIPVCGSVLGLDAAEIGLVKSLSAFIDMLLFYPAGQVMDRFGRKWTAVPSLLLLSVGVFLIGCAETYVTLIVGGVVAGVGNGLGSGINMTLAGDFSPSEGRAEFIGVWRLLSDAGGAVSPFVMGAVAHVLVLGAAGAITAAMGLVGVVVMATLVREPLRAAHPSRQG